MEMKIVLHGYWRSSAAYRVRIALNLKRLKYEQQSYDLKGNAQDSALYRSLAPQGLVPALEIDGTVLTQSLPIIEWLEERFPEPALLPKGHHKRAIARALSSSIACDIHPLNNLRVLRWLRGNFSADQQMIQDWVNHWISVGFGALETQVGRHGGDFCLGDAPTIADCALIPQIYNARRFNVDLAPYPLLTAIDARCAQLDAFQAALPERQPDAD